MKIIAAQKICNHDRSFAPGTEIDWPDSLPLPLDAGVAPAPGSSAEAVAAVYDALAKDHAKRIAHQEAFLQRKGLTPVQVETATLALQRYREQLTDVLNLAGKRQARIAAVRSAKKGPNPVNGDEHPTGSESLEPVAAEIGGVDDPLS